MASETNDPAAKARRVLDAGDDGALSATIAELHGRHGFIEDIDSHRYVERLFDRAEEQAITLIATVALLRADNAALRAVIATILATGKNIGDCEVRLVPFDTMKQARALLADTPTTRSDATQRNGNE